jgi:hypothetical protein
MLKGGRDELGQLVDAGGGQGADGEDLGGDHQAEQMRDGGGDIDLEHVLWPPFLPPTAGEPLAARCCRSE